MGQAIAIITARGGSKRIPRKNIKEFCGKPIIAYSIEAALESRVLDEVMVSTDDVEIAGIAKKYGAEVPFYRSEATANDFATTADVLTEVLHTYEKMGRSFERGCCIYPTAPFVTAKKLYDAMSRLSEDIDTVIPVTAYSFPPLRGVVIENGMLKQKWPEYFNMRSQDLQQIYHDAGQFYCFRVEAFLERGVLFGDRAMPYVVSDLEVQDIDNEEDWKLAELKYMYLKQRQVESYES